jgi:hypothetical protein
MRTHCRASYKLRLVREAIGRPGDVSDGLMCYDVRYYGAYLNRWTQPAILCPIGIIQSLNGETMTNEQPWGLLSSAVLQIVVATFISYNHRRLNIRRDAIWFIASYVCFVLNLYNFAVELTHAFPWQFTPLMLAPVVLVIAMVSILVGRIFDRVLVRLKIWH